MMNTRREFIRSSALGLCAVLTSQYIHGNGFYDQGKSIDRIRQLTLDYIEQMRLQGQPYGRYRYAGNISEATLYSSTYAAMTRGLYQDIETIPVRERKEWIQYLQLHQDEDGLFRDPEIYDQGWYKGDPDWCGRMHLSCHVLSALTCLGATPEKPIYMLEPFYRKEKLENWLQNRNWKEQADIAGNEVLNLGTLLQYARDFQKEAGAAKAMSYMLRWLRKNHINSQTGLWGNYDLEEKKGLSKAVMGAYHFWLLYFYDRHQIPYFRNAIDHVLSTLNSEGGFGWGVHGINSSACEDIDSIDPLARISILTNYRRKEIKNALEKSVSHVLATQNNDGGFVWIRNGGRFEYGHPLLATEKDESGMFPTWFRTLSLAYLGKALPDSVPGKFNWNFCSSPGYQFAIE